MKRVDRFVIVSLAENDDHGMPNGKVTGAHFADSANYDTCPTLELESSFVDNEDELDGPPCELRGKELQIGARTYGVHHFRPHVGNLCWNGYMITLGDARALAHDLTANHGFTSDGWTEGQPFLALDPT